MIACAAFPGSSGYYLNEAKQWITKSWGWLFILGVSCFVIFLLLLCVSKLGDIRLGDDDEEPEYPFLSWIAMLFAAGMGIGLMYFGVAEPISHYALPLDPNLSQGARAETAMLNTFFHWGIHSWAIYGVLGLALAYFGFRYHLPLTVRSGFYPLLKNRLDGALGRIIDITALCCTIFGITTTLGFGALQLGAGLKQIGFISHIDMPQLIVIIIVSISFSILSAISGVGKGVRHLSEINLLLALGLLLFVLLAGPSMMIMSDFTQNLGEYIHNIIPLSFRTFAYDPENEGWFTSWTVVYWAWWIAWAPFVGMFIAKISRGRTIREFVLGVLFVPTLFNLLWMTIFGNSAIWVDLQTNGSLSAISGETEALLFAFLNHLPLGSVTSFISVVIIALFFVTSADSGIFVINTIASYGKSGFPKWQSIFWGASLALLAIVLLYSGGLGALQAMTMVMALPFLVVMIVLCFCLWDGLLVDNGYFSRGLSVCTSYWTGSLWKERLHSMSRKPDLVNARKFIRELAEKVLKSGHREEVSCIISNKLKIISGACIVLNNGTYAFSIKLNNLVENTPGDTDRAGQAHFDRILQNVYSVYDNITLLDLAKRTSMNLAGRGETRGKLSKTGDLGQDHVIYFETCIYPADYERYLAFTDANTLSQRVEAEGHTGLSSFFRTKDKDGTYPWKMHTIIPVSRTGASKILYCVKGLSGDCAKMVGTAQEDIEERALEAYAERGVESKDILWKSLMNFSDVACFWKDREHRIRGINSKFMKSFGLSSEKDVIGKTSDEMGWIINEYSWKRSEDDVLISGRCIRNEMVDCVFQGTLKRIIYTEIPIYDEGEIIGILGWFIEEEQIEKSRENLKLTVTDPVTELLNSRGLLESMMTYSEMYQHYNVDYVMLFIFVPQYNQMLASYGKETADELLREVTSRINSVFGRSGPVGRINGGEFILLFHYEDQGAVSDMSRKLKEEISHIDHVKNIPCKVDANTLITYGSDKIAAGKLMEQAIGIIRSGGAEISVDDWVNKGELFDRIPIPYVLLDVPIGNDGMISGIICRYKNTAYEKMMGIHNKTELEKRFSDLLDTPDYTWRQRLYEAAYEGRTVFNQKYFPEEGEWLDYLFFRGPRRGTCSAMILHRDKSTVQAAPRVLNYSTDHLVNYLMDILIKGENYGTAIGSVLKEIGIIISADRVFIGNIQNQSVSYPFSWCREGLASIKNLGFTGADFDEYVEMRKHLLEKNDSIAISDIDDIKETDRVTYQFLKAHDVHSIAEVPIFRDNHLYGFLGVINYDRENGVDVRYMLEKVAGYLDLKARNQELMDTLKYMSGNNLLTGLHNRNAMSKKVEELKLHRTPVGIIYADLNNLKATNDTYGHDAGDLRLKEIADIMKEIFDLDDIYRLGGDEFIIIMDNVKKLDKMDKLRKFKKVIRNRSVDVAIGFEWVENASEFDFGMKSADKKMYRNKKKYYKTHKLTERGDERAAAR